MHDYHELTDGLLSQMNDFVYYHIDIRVWPDIPKCRINQAGYPATGKILPDYSTGNPQIRPNPKRNINTFIVVLIHA